MKKTLCTTLILSTLPLAGLLAGCAGSAARARTAETPASAQRIVVQGELTDNGLGCSALRGADGTLYTLARELEGTKKGDSVRIEGYIVPNQGCAVGVSLMPRRAVAVAAPIPAITLASRESPPAL